MSEWFLQWFNSPYYHVLYAHRGQDEADLFIGKLCEKLNLPKNAHITDLGCGTGRHCIALHKHNFMVSGIDLSENSIAEALKISPKEITYYQADMRKPLPVKQQHAVLNLFTSFGYFNSLQENMNVLKNIHQALLPKGYIVLDYLNAGSVTHENAEPEIIIRNHISFSITKKRAGNSILKKIEFVAKNQTFSYTEKVDLFTLNDFSDMFRQTGFQILHTFGNYMLNPYSSSSSPRLIIVAHKA
jgi:SAM-dependent methyltransferase